MTLCLPAPYGWDAGDGACISLTTTGPVDYDALERVLLSYSCWPPAIPKIKTTLFHSNRYDCVLQMSWFAAPGARANVTRDLAAIGVTLHFKGWLKQVRGDATERDEQWYARIANDRY